MTICVRCSDFPKNKIVGDCPECAVHKKGRSMFAIRLSRANVNKLFENFWYSAENHIEDYADFYEIRVKWLTLLYAAGWTEDEFEQDTIQIAPHRRLNPNVSSRKYFVA